MRENHVDDLVDAYALGALEPVEVDAVERHLATCASCRALVEQARSLPEGLLFAVPQVTPPPDLRARLIERIRGEAEGNPTSLPARSREAKGVSNPFTRILHRLLGDEESEGDASAAGTLLRELLAEPDCVIVPMGGTDQAPQASGRFVGSPSRRHGVLVTHGLRPSAPGEAYQVWFLHDGQPTPNAVFYVSHAGHGAGVFALRQPLQTYDTVAVTPEPEVGSPSPTGPIVLVGSLSQARA